MNGMKRIRVTGLVLAMASLGLGSGCYQGLTGASGGETASATDSGGTDTADSDTDTVPPPEAVNLVPESMARRMTPVELDNTIRDLLFDDSISAMTYVSESEYTPFDNNYAFQDASGALIESLEVYARDIAQGLINDPLRRDMVVPCTPTGPDDATCFRAFVESFVRKAMRRPLSEEEITTYMGLQSFATESTQFVDNDFYTGVALVIQAVLQDPDFLYRVEVGTPTTEPGISRLSSVEIASRMSYLLWGSLPDDALLADAEAGMLEDPAGREAAAERMLSDERTFNQLRRYHAMWLGYRAIPHGPELTAAFDMETSALIKRVIFDERAPYQELLTSDETYIDDFLASHYGLPAPAGGEGWVSLAGSGRSGLLGQGSVLSGFSKFTDTSPTQRGIFIRDRLLCLETPDPPPDIDIDAAPVDPLDPNACKEDRYAAHREIQSCAVCHALFDPIGAGLENYDIGGVFRATDEGRPECTISGEGSVPGLGAFNGPAELAATLVESDDFRRCVTQHYLEFAYGRELLSDEGEHVDDAVAKFDANGMDFAALMTEYITAEAFGFRREPSE